eukprot:26445-Pelagomonas_calceolata.AAC.3
MDIAMLGHAAFVNSECCFHGAHVGRQLAQDNPGRENMQPAQKAIQAENDMNHALIHGNPGRLSMHPELVI